MFLTLYGMEGGHNNSLKITYQKRASPFFDIDVIEVIFKVQLCMSYYEIMKA